MKKRACLLTTAMVVALSSVLPVSATESVLAETDITVEETTVNEVSKETAEMAEILESETEESKESESEAVILESETEESKESESETEILESETDEEDPYEASYSNKEVYQFVKRLYEKVLGRSADPAGLDMWYNDLVNHRRTGAEVSRGFVFSQEFIKKNTSNINYVKLLYTTFFNRTPANSEEDTWVELLDKGISRYYVFAGFTNSSEFRELCQKYNVDAGTSELTDAMDQNPSVTYFVARCYDIFLGRYGDSEGLNLWCGQLLSGEKNAKEVAAGFVFSNEFKGMNLNNRSYLNAMYEGFFDRNPDSAGYAQWLHKLDVGTSRDVLFHGFADSDEFRELADSFGLSNSWPSYVPDYAWPCDSKILWQNFNPSSSHNGIDIDGEEGDPIYAMADGKVIISQWITPTYDNGGAGNWIVIDHGDGMLSVYMHASKLLVTQGAIVTKGQKIALIGNTGNSFGAHLHFGIKINTTSSAYVHPYNTGEWVDPLKYIKK